MRHTPEQLTRVPGIERLVRETDERPIRKRESESPLYIRSSHVQRNNGECFEAYCLSSDA
jgi:hypothetical protein